MNSDSLSIISAFLSCNGVVINCHRIYTAPVFICFLATSRLYADGMTVIVFIVFFFFEGVAFYGYSVYCGLITCVYFYAFIAVCNGVVGYGGVFNCIASMGMEEDSVFFDICDVIPCYGCRTTMFLVFIPYIDSIICSVNAIVSQGNFKAIL